MLRRMFLKLFPSMAAAPVSTEAVVEKESDDVISEPTYFAKQERPRNLVNYGLSSDLLSKLGIHGYVRRSDVARLDSLLKAKGVVPRDAVLEIVFPAYAQQECVILRFRHKSFPLVRGLDCIVSEGVEESKVL